MSPSRIRRLFIVVVIFIWSVFIALTIVKILRGDLSYSQSAMIEDFHVCDSIYSKEHVLETIKVCGVIVVDEIARLNIYVYKLPGRELVGSNPVNDDFLSGNFTRVLRVNIKDMAGEYIVEVYRGRQLIASDVFFVK